MIDSKTSVKIDRILSSLKPEAKHQIFEDMEVIGLRIEFGTDTWNNFMYHKARRTKGKISKLYKLFGTFEKDDVEVFFNAFTESTEGTEGANSLSVKKNKIAIYLEER
jgi:hypothetical protein